MRNKKVYLMLSGGVDSSVAGSVLKKQGFNVIGIYMKCWSKEQLQLMGLSEELYACNWEDDLMDAKTVAKILDIPFEVWDFQKEYRQAVVEYMILEYKSGRTPNPDVMCNSTIKFGVFYQRARNKGADFVATGHYAKIGSLKDYKFILKGKDKNKDQSYFLWKIKADQIQTTLFPIGNFASKTEVRNYAKKKGLITATKKDSQGLCFVGKTPLRGLLLETLGSKEGDIVSLDNKVLGKHKGAYLYTIGQREKLGLSGGPWFVSKIDIKNNIVQVAHQNNQMNLYGNQLIAKDCNWHLKLSDIKKLKSISAQTRYRQNPIDCKLEFITNLEVRVFFLKPVRAIAKGQSIVFYFNEIMLGGAVIS